jgi:hypothetical protein
MDGPGNAMTQRSCKDVKSWSEVTSLLKLVDYIKSRIRNLVTASHT